MKLLKSVTYGKAINKEEQEAEGTNRKIVKWQVYTTNNNKKEHESRYSSLYYLQEIHTLEHRQVESKKVEGKIM